LFFLDFSIILYLYLLLIGSFMPHTLAIVGGGPAGLRAAEALSEAGCAVTLFDAKPTVGRKFLMAGRGGLNLTHSDPLPEFLKKYGAAEPLMARAFNLFSPSDLREWCHGLGFETFVGTSGRIYPKGMKASPLLRAWLKRLAEKGVRFALRHRWTGWKDGALTFDTAEGKSESFESDATLLALGGASWPHLGSDGKWTEILASAGVPLAPLRPANCGFTVGWSDIFRSKYAGQPLKPVVLAFEGHRQRGEIMVTQSGLEGSLIYAFGAALRDRIEATGSAAISLDLRPDLSIDELTKRLNAPRGSQSLANHLRKAGGLSPVAASLIRESINTLPPNAPELAARIKSMPVILSGTGPLARAISSAGGIKLDALDDTMMLKAKPGVFVAGEMMDWEAQTGGYLLQGCFSTGTLAAQGMLQWLKLRSNQPA
jgi:uncharacterized flavoprotein (TIGR03862 family)